MFSLICVWKNVWVNNREADDLRRYRAHYDVSVMIIIIVMSHEHHGVSIHRQRDRSFNSLSRLTTKKTANSCSTYPFSLQKSFHVITPLCLAIFRVSRWIRSRHTPCRDPYLMRVLSPSEWNSRLQSSPVFQWTTSRILISRDWAASVIRNACEHNHFCD